MDIVILAGTMTIELLFLMLTIVGFSERRASRMEGGKLWRVLIRYRQAEEMLGNILFGSGLMAIALMILDAFIVIGELSILIKLALVIIHIAGYLEITSPRWKEREFRKERRKLTW